MQLLITFLGKKAPSPLTHLWLSHSSASGRGAGGEGLQISCKLLRLAGLMALTLVVLACGPSDEEIDRRIQEFLSSIPTATPIVFPTPLPTTTPAPTATPQPIPTPIPTPTPLVFPPTPTPINLPPTPTPQLAAISHTNIDFSQVHHNAWRAVFLIDTPRRKGSGWLIEPGLILTNQHVVADYPRVTVRQSVDPPFTAEIVATDSLRDIALLQFNPAQVQLPPQTEPLPLGQISNDNIAQALMALGYSGARLNGNGNVGPAAANIGVLSQVADFGPGNFGRNLVMDAPVDPGDSGGPVLNANGEVVGMTRAVAEQTVGGQRVVGTFYAVHIDEILASLPALKRGESR
jgi:S1-C subfamily serine protease